MQAVFFGLQGHLFSDAPRPAGLRMPQISGLIFFTGQSLPCL